ncbi:MAG: hypothetical protein MAG451_01333 [Anaerolineales bacterium]|nr:hypothetical protein [Anaerolineales bacterium]
MLVEGLRPRRRGRPHAGRETSPSFIKGSDADFPLSAGSDISVTTNKRYFSGGQAFHAEADSKLNGIIENCRIGNVFWPVGPSPTIWSVVPG